MKGDGGGDVKEEEGTGGKGVFNSAVIGEDQRRQSSWDAELSRDVI